VYNQYRKFVLKNGLRVVLVPNPTSAVVTATIIFKVGSRYEEDKEAGISHVLEHMHYKGTKKRPNAVEIAEFIESVGGEHNAFTAKEYTGYYAKVPASHLEDALDFLGDILQNSLFDSKELEKEKVVVLHEFDMYEDIPVEVASNQFEKCLFGNNSLGREIIGTKKSILSITPKDLFAFKEKFYTASNAVLVIAGNVGGKSDRELIKLFERYFDLPQKSPFEPQQIKIIKEKCLKVYRRRAEQSHIIIGFHGPKFSDPDRFGIKMLALILGGSMSSRMFVEIREKKNLAYAIRSSVTNYLEAGFIDTHAGVGHEMVYETISSILTEYRKIKEAEIPEREVQKAKEIIRGRLMISFEDSEEAANHYAIDELMSGEILTQERLDEIYSNITAKELYVLSHKYLDDDKMSLACVGPSAKEDEIKKIFKL